MILLSLSLVTLKVITRGRQLMDTIEESPPVILVCKLIIYTSLSSQSTIDREIFAVKNFSPVA